jgi:hypothetical protein
MNLRRWITDTFFGGSMLRTGKEEDGSYFYFMNSANVELPYKTLYEIFRNIPHLRAVIERKAVMFSNARFKIVKTNTEEYEVDYKHKLNAILTNPNKLQSWRQMLFMISLIKSIQGVSFLKPGFGLLNKPDYLVSLKPIDFESYQVEDDKNKNFLQEDDFDKIIHKYRFYLKNGGNIAFAPSEILAFKDTYIGYMENPSRITTLMEPIKNIYKALIARGILIDKKGGIGALTGNQKDGGVQVPMKKGEKKKIRRSLDGYGLGQGKESIIVTDVPMRFTPFVFPTNQLMLFEEIVDDFNTICDVYGMCRELFVGDAAYAATRKQAEADTYENTIATEWEDFYDLLNDGLHTAEDNIRVEADFSHISAMQKSEKENVEVQEKKSNIYMGEMEKGIIDEDEYRQQMGYEAKK